MALFQASTINADTISNGIGFLFLGASLAFASRELISWKSWWILLGLIALLFMAKVNLIFLVLLPFLLIRPSRFKMKYGYLLMAAAAVVLFLVEVGGWNVVAYSHFTRALEGANPGQQVRYILSAPWQFIKIIANDVWTNTPAYMQGWVGVYGYNYFPVPAPTYWLYPLAVIAALAAAVTRVPPQPAELSSASAPIQPERSPHPVPGLQPRRIEQMRTPLVLLLLFIIGYLLTIASLYVAFTPVRSQLVAGVQGRYFTTVMPLPLLALVVMFAYRGEPAGRPWPANIRIPTALPVILGLSALLLYVGGLILSYHVPCGSEYYRFGLCYQPEYKNWAPEASSSPPVAPAMTLTQEIVPACDGMQQLLVWVNSPGSDPAGTTQVTLRAPQEEKDLVRQTFKNASIPEDGWLKLNFPPEWQSSRNLYLLTLSSSSAGGMQVGYSAKSEYLKGKLTENGSPVEQDMLFQYGCIAGLQRWQIGK